MKKKIKDLTQEDIEKLCKHHHHSIGGYCDSYCPLKDFENICHQQSAQNLVDLMNEEIDL